MRDILAESLHKSDEPTSPEKKNEMLYKLADILYPLLFKFV